MNHVRIRRQWNDWRIASAPIDRLSGLRWDKVPGDVRAPAPQFFIHGYVACTDVVGEIAHSCAHGEGPHSIKVSVVKKDNDAQTWAQLIEIVGSKPRRPVR
jgi:hypothetical protein